LRRNQAVNKGHCSMKSKTRYGLTESDITDIVILLSGNPKVKKIILFGSRAKGSHNNGSDVDIALKGDNLVLRDVLDFMTGIEDLSLPNKFDLVIYNRIKDKELREHIDRVGIILFDRSES